MTLQIITEKAQKAAKNAKLWIALIPKLLYIRAFIAIMKATNWYLKLKNKRLETTISELEQRRGLGRTETWTS